MGTKRRFVVVLLTEIHYYREQDSDEPAGIIPLNNFGVAFDEKFTIFTGERIYTFWAETERDHEVWTNVFARIASVFN